MPQSKFKSGIVCVTVDYGYDLHSLTISGRTYARIQQGRPVKVKGQGFWAEGEREQDYWSFNLDRAGSVSVTTEALRDVFVGDLTDCEISR